MLKKNENEVCLERIFGLVGGKFVTKVYLRRTDKSEMTSSTKKCGQIIYFVSLRNQKGKNANLTKILFIVTRMTKRTMMGVVKWTLLGQLPTLRAIKKLEYNHVIFAYNTGYFTKLYDDQMQQVRTDQSQQQEIYVLSCDWLAQTCCIWSSSNFVKHPVL